MRECVVCVGSEGVRLKAVPIWVFRQRSGAAGVAAAAIAWEMIRGDVTDAAKHLLVKL